MGLASWYLSSRVSVYLPQEDRPCHHNGSPLTNLERHSVTAHSNHGTGEKGES